MSLLGLGKIFANGGEKIATKLYAFKYGKQIGKTAKNGNKVFCRTERNGCKVLTGIDREGNIISQVKNYYSGPNVINFKGDLRTVRTGETEKAVYDEFGRIVQQRYSERGAQMYTNTVINYNHGLPNIPLDVKKTKLYFGDTPRMYVMDSSKRGQFVQTLG